MQARTLVISSVVVLALLVAALTMLQWSASPDQETERLMLYCAAGIRAPVADTIKEYERYWEQEHGRPLRVEVEYGGSGTLLSRLKVAGECDLFLAGDDWFIERGREQGLVAEELKLATMVPVIAISPDKVEQIRSLDDLLAGDFRVAMGVVDGSAIGEATKQAMDSINAWEAFENKVEVTKPTVNDLASDVQLGAVDAAVIWDITARQHELQFVHHPALDAQTATVSIGVTTATTQPAAALHFARFLASPEHGLPHFEEHHFNPIEGDRWSDTPEVTFFGGGLNRKAMEPIIDAFQKREGVRVNAVFQGCGALNAQMRTVEGQDPAFGFPDAYLACDVYYMEPVGDWFDNKAAISSTRIVIVTAKGNPHNIQSVADLAKPGLRVVVSHPTHSTLGGLTERLLKVEGVYDEVMKNVIEQQPSSGYMVPPVVSGAADASLAYYPDTLAERNKIDTVELETAFAKAVQPFGIATTSKHRHLMRRFYEFISQRKDEYEALGFDWVIGRPLEEFEVFTPKGVRQPPGGTD